MRARVRQLSGIVLSLALGAGFLFGLTAINAVVTRQLLRQQVAMLGGPSTDGWSAELADLRGGLTSTHFRIHVHGPGGRNDTWDVTGALYHRLLTMRGQGALVRAHEGGTAGASGQSLASFQVDLAVDPGTVALRWTATFAGRRLAGQAGRWQWTLGPWKAALRGDDRQARMTLVLPGLNVSAGNLGRAKLSHIDLAFRVSSSRDPQSQNWISGRLGVGSLALRSPRGMIDAVDMNMHGTVAKNSHGWPFQLHLDGVRLVNKGFPFLRLTGLHYSASGFLKPELNRKGNDRRTEMASLVWHSSQKLTAGSNYGPVAADAETAGVAVEGGDARLSRFLLSGHLPTSLWMVFQYVDPALADELTAQGVAIRHGDEVQIHADYAEEDPSRSGSR